MRLHGEGGEGGELLQCASTAWQLGTSSGGGRWKHLHLPPDLGDAFRTFQGTSLISPVMPTEKLCALSMKRAFACHQHPLEYRSSDDRALSRWSPPHPRHSPPLLLLREKRPIPRMRNVAVSIPLAVLLGLAGSSTAFLQGVRPTNFVVPAHKYNAAVSRTRVAHHRPAAAARSVRVMSAAVDTETEATDEVAEIPAAPEDPISPALEVRETGRGGERRRGERTPRALEPRGSAGSRYRVVANTRRLALMYNLALSSGTWHVAPEDERCVVVRAALPRTLRVI